MEHHVPSNIKDVYVPNDSNTTYTISNVIFVAYLQTLNTLKCASIEILAQQIYLYNIKFPVASNVAKFLKYIGLMHLNISTNFVTK